MFVTVAAGAAIGLAWPSARTAERDATSAEVVLQRDSDHHYYADATVNGHAIRFMIDTGASEIVLTADDASKVGIPVDPANLEVIGDGASGMVRGQFAVVETIDLKGIRQQDTKVAVVPGASVSLLGQPFLERVDEIVIRKAEMRLKSGTPN